MTFVDVCVRCGTERPALTVGCPTCDDLCAVCHRGIVWSDGSRCYVVRAQALPPACRNPETGETVRGHTPPVGVRT